MAFTRNPYLGQMQQNTYATGAKRYGDGYGTAATSGQLSSDGYEERRRKMLEKRRVLERQIRMRQQGAGMVDPNQRGGFR